MFSIIDTFRYGHLDFLIIHIISCPGSTNIRAHVPEGMVNSSRKCSIVGGGGFQNDGG